MLRKLMAYLVLHTKLSQTLADGQKKYQYFSVALFPMFFIDAFINTPSAKNNILIIL